MHLPHEAEELARALFEESGDALFLFDPALDRLLDANPAAQRLSGFSRTELLRLALSYLVRSDVPGGLQRLRHAQQKTGPFHASTGYLLRTHKDGVWIPVSLTVSRLHLHERTLGLMTARDVSDRRRAEEALRTSEERLARVVETIADGTVILDLSGKITFANAAAEAILGWPRAVLATLTRDDERWPIIHVDGSPVPEAERTFTRVMATGQPVYSVERAIRQRDSSVRSVSINAAPLRDGAGAVVGMVGSLHDITSAKHAEAQLRESQRALATLLGNLPGMAYRCCNDQDWNMLFVSEGCLALTGYEPADLIERRRVVFADLIHSADRTRVWEAVQQAVKKDQPFQFTYRLRTAQGEVKWVWEQGRGVFGSNGELVALEGFITDVTERVRADQALQASEERYRLLFERNLAGVFRSTLAGDLIDCNDAFAHIFGYGNRAEAMAHRALELYFATEDRERLLETLRERSSITNYECRMRRKDGSPVWVLENISLLRDEQGTEFLEGTVSDVTERRHLEEQLRQSARMQVAGQLAGGLAHDFNNLLTGILGNASLALLRLPADDPNRDLLQAIDQAASRAAELTGQLLGFTKQSTLRPRPLDLNDTVSEVVGLMQHTLGERIDIEVNMARDIATVRADPGQMNQVLLNLCLNARDAMPNGGRLTLTTENVTLSADQSRWHIMARPGRFSRLRVADTGHGMSAEVQTRIFEPFFSTKGPGKGVGLGLAMAFGIVQQHEGWIECHSEVGRGTHFDIYLPRCDDQQTADPQPPPQLGALASRGSETVLLVDDDEMIRRLGEAVLTQYGYRVLLAADGWEALDLFQQERTAVSVILLDLTLPKLSGQETLARLRAVDAIVRVIFCSAHNEPELASPADGVQAFVKKPYRTQELLGTIRAVLDGTLVPST
jgi:PAS domain S-box-containing protein